MLKEKTLPVANFQQMTLSQTEQSTHYRIQMVQFDNNPLHHLILALTTLDQSRALHPLRRKQNTQEKTLFKTCQVLQRPQFN